MNRFKFNIKKDLEISKWISLNSLVKTALWVTFDDEFTVSRLYRVYTIDSSRRNFCIWSFEIKTLCLKIRQKDPYWTVSGQPAIPSYRTYRRISRNESFYIQ